MSHTPQVESTESMGFHHWPLLRQILARPWGAVGSPNASASMLGETSFIASCLINVFTPRKTNMTMENPPFEDVFPIEMEIFQCHVSFHGCI